VKRAKDFPFLGLGHHRRSLHATQLPDHLNVEVTRAETLPE
jgi:hypothetical protein